MARKEETYIQKKNKAVVGLFGSLFMPALVFYMLFFMGPQKPLDTFQIGLVTYMAIACAFAILGACMIITKKRAPAMILGTIGGAMCITMFPIGTILAIMALMSLHDRQFKEKWFSLGSDSESEPTAEQSAQPDAFGAG